MRGAIVGGGILAGMGWAEFFALCEAAGGVVRIAPAARAAGLDRGTVRRRAAAEGWWRPYPDVTASPGTPLDPRARALAATLHVAGRTGRGDRDVVAATRWTAAHLLGLRQAAPTRTQLVVTATRHLRARPGLEIVRSRDLRRAEVRKVADVPTVVPARLLRDLASVCDDDALRAVTIDALHKRLLRLDDLARALARWPSFPGRPRLGRVVAQLAAAGRTDSPLEFEARERLVASGIPLDPGQVRVPLVGGGVLHLDLGIAAICFAVEVDSFAFHSHRDDVSRDAVRANEVAAVEADWRVLHLTWDIIRAGWSPFVARVKEVVAAQARRYLGTAWPHPVPDST